MARRVGDDVLLDLLGEVVGLLDLDAVTQAGLTAREAEVATRGEGR